MKKILLLILSFMAILNSCDLDINDDPNNLSEVEPTFIFPAVQNAIAVVVGDAMYNYAGFFAQYYDQMPEANQYNTIAEYNFDETTQLLDRSYNLLYAGALQDIKMIYELTENTSDIFAATVLRAFCFQLLVDNIDQTPYSEALDLDIVKPKWDAGQSIYEGILAELDAAEAELSNEAMECSDLMLNKNVSQWVGFANALRLRMYLRFIDAGINTDIYTTRLRALIDKGEFFTDNITMDVYSDEQNKRNPWYQTNRSGLSTQNHVASYPIIQYLKQTNDPRIAYNFIRATNTEEYQGELPGSKQELSSMKNADYSFLNYYATKPVYFFCQSELQFLLAECYLRFYNDNSRAQIAYEAGIDADFAARGMEESGSVMYNGSVNWSSATSEADKLKLIYLQKWVALCYMDHMEAWSEIRRTGYPTVSSHTARAIYDDPTIYTSGELIAPMRNGLGTGVMVKRMYFPRTPGLVNENRPGIVEPDVPVWWDKN